MVKKKVNKKAGKKPTNPLSALDNIDKTISKAMKDMNASINISIQTTIPSHENKKRKKK